MQTSHKDLLWVKTHIYEPFGLQVHNIKFENESSDYGAAEFTIGNKCVKFRTGKITPTKIGQFVTFWQRIDNGPILPYHFNDKFDLLIVCVRAEDRFGQFIFPKKTLCNQGIVSTEAKEGKRAIRIYPPWDKADNPQSKRTQSWQLEWFLEFPKNKDIDVTRLKYLLNYSNI